MKNVIVIASDGEQLVSSTHDTTNALFINDVEIDSSLWVGSGSYTDTIEGHEITIAKAADLTGNYQLIKISDFNYEFVKVKTDQQKLLEQIIDIAHPVNSLYWSEDSTDPSILFPGTTWQAITDTFILAAGSSYAVDIDDYTAQHGEATHVLTPAETATKNHSHTINHGHGFTQPKIPNHRHNMSGRNWSSGSGGSTDAYTYSSNRKTGTYYTATDGGGGACTGGAVVNHTGSSGGLTEANGSAHNNMPPYLVRYCWQRIS